MNRLPIGIAAVALLGAVLFFSLYNPEGRSAAKVGEATLDVVDLGPPIEPIVPARPLVKKSPDAQRVKAPRDAGPKVADAKAEAEQGPFTVNLGKHKIVLRERDRALNVALEFVVRDMVTRKEALRQRSRLVRMLFFLGSHRAAEGAISADAEARFEADFLSRIRNVLKTGPVLRMKITHWEVEDWSAPEIEDEE